MAQLVALGRFVLALALAPVLFFSLGAEVFAGTSHAWWYVQLGQLKSLWFAISIGFALCGPLAVTVATIRTRSRISNMTGRVLRIEKWGLAVGFPLGLVGLFVTVAQSIVM